MSENADECQNCIKQAKNAGVLTPCKVKSLDEIVISRKRKNYEKKEDKLFHCKFKNKYSDNPFIQYFSEKLINSSLLTKDNRLLNIKEVKSYLEMYFNNEDLEFFVDYLIGFTYKKINKEMNDNKLKQKNKENNKKVK